MVEALPIQAACLPSLGEAVLPNLVEAVLPSQAGVPLAHRESRPEGHLAARSGGQPTVRRGRAGCLTDLLADLPEHRQTDQPSVLCCLQPHPSDLRTRCPGRRYCLAAAAVHLGGHHPEAPKAAPSPADRRVAAAKHLVVLLPRKVRPSDHPPC